MQPFRQGHLVDSPPFVYVATPAHAVWALTSDLGDTALAEEVFELDSLDRPPYGLITTQTCDINEVNPNHPWVHIAPVYDLDEGTLAAMVRKDRVNYLVELDPPTLDGLWVADLRLEVPVEKSWLVGRQPAEAYPTEAGYEHLAGRLAGKRDRPALADSLVMGVYRPLREWLDRSQGKKASANVREVRFRLGGTRLIPWAASLVLIKDTDWENDETAAWDDWWDLTRAKAAGYGLDLLANEYQTLDSMSARQYLDSTPVNLDYLSN
jgi:hypothetical protein